MSSKLSKLMMLGVALVLVGSASGAGAALAAPGGKGATSSPSATLTVSPNPAPAYSSFHGQGCGYVVGKAVNIVVKQPTVWIVYPVGPDASGCIDFYGTTGAPGAYTVEASQSLGGKRPTLMASATLLVQ